jgi:glycosyltransferase involved in cell wall biosynthesis
MRIALVCDWYAPRLGGIESHLSELGKRLSEAGHEVHVITPTRTMDADSGSVVVHRIDTPLFPGFRFLFTPGGVSAIGRVLADGAFDVVHSHVSIVSPAAFAGAALANRLGIPSVITFHSFIPATGAFMRAVAAFTGSHHWKAMFTAVSEKVAREVAPISSRPIGILPNGIDTDFWKAQSGRERDTNWISILSVLRLNSKKRPFALLDVATALRRRLDQQIAFELTIAGDGPLYNALSRAVDRRKIGHLVRLVGRVTREELRDLYSESDIFVLPTVRESFGLAALEARSMGVPVVAMRESALAEQITHERNGLLAESDEDLVGCVERLIVEPGLRRVIAENNRMTPVPNDWLSVVERHTQTYREAGAIGGS